MFDGFSSRGSGAFRVWLVAAVLPAAVLCCAGCEGGGEQSAGIRLKGGVQQVGETEGTIVSPEQDPVAKEAIEFARRMDQSAGVHGGDSATGGNDAATQFDGPAGASAGARGGGVVRPTVSGVRVEESGPVEEVVWLTPDEGAGSGGVVTASLSGSQTPAASPRRAAQRVPVIDVEPAAEVVIDEPIEVAAVEGAERAGGAELSEAETEELVRELRERLVREAGEGDGSLRAYLAAASLSVAEPGGELTEEQLAVLDVEARRGVLAYQRALAQLGRELGDGATGEEAMRLAAEEIVEQMRSERSLRILNPKLCISVEGYGVYEEFKSATFLAGVSQRVVIYAELENFAPRVESGGGYEVQLSHEVALHNESDGLVVWRQKPVEITDRSKNRRRDFFVVQLVELPSRLTVGKYRLKLTITDQIGGTVDEASMPIEVVADESLSKAGR